MKMLSLAIAMVACAAPAIAAPAPKYAVSGAIAAAGDGSWDYASVDAANNRLYVARQASVSVVDLAAGKALPSIGTIERGHAAVPIGGQTLLVTSGNDATVRLLSTVDGHELGKIAVGKKADAALYVAATKRAYVMNADSGTVSVIDVSKKAVTSTIQLKPALEYAAFDKKGLLFINDEETNEIEIVDAAQGKVLAPIALTGCEAPSGMAYDLKTDRVISACANGKAAIVDAGHRKLVGLVDIGIGPDAVILDAARRVAFLPCGKDGVLDILSLDGAQVTRVARVKTEVGARTGALDPRTGAVYLPTARFSAAVDAKGRPTPVPGSFHVLVVKPL